MDIDELGEDDASLARFAALCVALDPLADDVSIDDIRRWDRMTGEHLRLGVHRDDVLVGACAIYGQPHDPESQTLPCQLLLPAELRGSGLGDELLARMMQWARERHPEPSISVGISVADLGLIEFWNARGLVEVHRYVELELPLTDLDPIRPAGSPTIVSIAERPDLLETMWELVRDTWRDMPGDPGTPPPFEQWREHFDDGRRPLGGALLALDNDSRAIGVTTTGANPDDLEHAWTNYTGVRGDARGRGVAMALKLRQVEWCRCAGYRRLTTGNHTGNAPMLAINERLGFRESKVVVQMQGDAVPTDTLV